MKRSKRIIFAPLLLAIIAVTIVLASISRRSAPEAQGLRGFPTTQYSGREAYLFSPTGAFSPLIVMSPDTWYAVHTNHGRPLAGDISTGRVLWLGGSALPAGLPARGDGMIFIPVPHSIGTPDTIRVLDECSRAQVRSYLPPGPVSQLYWCDGIVLGVGAQTIYAFDSITDKLLWTFDAKGAIRTDLTMAGGRIYFTCDTTAETSHFLGEYAMCAVNARDGNLLWRTTVPHFPVGAPVIDGDTIYCASQQTGYPYSKALSAFDLKTGKPRWESAEFAAIATSSDATKPAPRLYVRPPAVANGAICIPISNMLYGIDSATGKLRWRYVNGDGQAPPSDDRAIGPALLRGGTAFVAVRDGALAIDCKTGEEVWRYENQGASFSNSRYSGNEVRKNPDGRTSPRIFGNVLLVCYAGGYLDFVLLPVPAMSPSMARAIPVKAGFVLAGLGVVVVILIASLALKRMRTVVAAVSAGLCALAIWAWLTSYNGAHFIGGKEFASAPKLSAETARGITSANGRLIFGSRRLVWETSITRPVQGDATSTVWWTRQSRQVLSNGACLDEAPADLGMTHFAWAHRSRPSGTALGNQSETSLTVPHWFVIVLLAIAPFAWMSGYWRDGRRYLRGHCPKCGYDLRATTERCPECGQLISVAR